MVGKQFNERKSPLGSRGYEPILGLTGFHCSKSPPLISRSRRVGRGGFGGGTKLQLVSLMVPTAAIW
jgi:hypothetical protein